MNSIVKLGLPIFFLPLTVITGPLIPDLTVTLSSIFFLIVLVVNKNFEYFKTKYFLFFFCFWTFISLNSFISQNIDSIKTSITYLRFGVFFVLLSFLFTIDKNFSNNFRKVILFCFLILFLDSIIQHFFGYNILGMPKSGRISSFFGDEKIMGSYIIKLLPIYIALYYFNKKLITLNLHIVLIISICSLLVLLSMERSALGLLVLYLFLISFIFLNKIKQFLIYFFLIFIFLMVFFSISDHAYHRFISQVAKDITVKNLSNKNDEVNVEKKRNFYAFTQAHDQLINTSYKLFLDKPIIGHGTKMFRYKCIEKQKIDNLDKDFCSTHPHNYYFQMLAENGLIGFLFIIFLFVYFCFFYIKNLYFKNNDRLLNLFIVPNIINLWPIVPHGNFFNNWISITIFLSLGFYVCYIQFKLFKKY